MSNYETNVDDFHKEQEAAKRLSKQEKVKVIVCLQGGCVTGLVAGNFVDWTVFDWDDFKEDPQEYWNSMDEDMREYLRMADPEMYQEIQEGLSK